MRRIKIKALDGSSVEHDSEKFASGGTKDLYHATDGINVVGIYRSKEDVQARARLESIVGKYDPTKDPAVGEFWKSVFCWPSKVVQRGSGHLGVVVPHYSKYYFFASNKNGCNIELKGKEKEGKWFASPMLRNFLPTDELGTWASYFTIGILLSRAVRKLHLSGLAHSDLSYKNVLIDPKGGHACIIDIDGLVVPGKFPPEVIGTPDFIAPEVLRTNHLEKNAPDRKYPNRETDLHALAVLIYLYLLYRHPLKGGKIHSMDPETDEKLMMGEHALFVEHPTNRENRIKEKPKNFMPWVDTDKIPYTITGPYLTPLFDRAFIDGLHHPSKRPHAQEWEAALIKTADLLYPCPNSACPQKWFVITTPNMGACPFCGTVIVGEIPELNFYKRGDKEGQFGDEKYRYVIYHNKPIYHYHLNDLRTPNERSSEHDKRRVGYFQFHNKMWLLFNEDMPDLRNLINDRAIPKGASVEIKNQGRLLLENKKGGRLVSIKF